MKKLFFALLFFCAAVHAQNIPFVNKATGTISVTTAQIPGLIPVTTISVSNPATGQTYFTGILNVTQPAGYSLSSGVYDLQGNLLRTLTSAQPLTSQNNIQWDGKDDAGNTLSPGKYQIKYLTSNVQYTWEGGIGDSSTEPLTNTRLSGNDYTTMVTAGNNAFFSNGYSEHSSPERNVALSDINKIIPFTGANTTTMNMLASCTDESAIYFAGDKGGDPTNPYQTWLIGTYPADLTDPFKFIQFPTRVTVSYKGGSGDFVDQNAIAYSNDANSYISSISVQKTGNDLFLTRPGLNRLQVIDKRASSGAVLQTLSITGIGEVAADANTYLYALVGGQVIKYTVNSDATLTNTNTSFTGVSNGSKIAYSAFLNKIAVFDNTTFQIKIYNPAGGAAVQVIGGLGGYTSSPYFDGTRFADANFIYYQEDGTLWLGQPALHSVLHYNLDFTLKEETQHLPTSRACAVDQNNPSRVFSNYNEFARDYSKTLDNGANGSWKFAANWAKGVNTSNLNYDGIVWDCTLSNNRNYALIYTGGRNQLNELTSTGPRLISDYFSGDIGRDGTLYQYGNNNSNGNQATGIYKSSLTGFDNNNNPVWASPSIWIPNPPTSNYVPWRGYQNNTSGLTASADGYIYFDNGTGLPSLNGNNTPGYRLGKVKASTGQPVWATARTTAYNYSGPHPADGSFDIGNNTGYFPQHSETHAMVYDTDIFWNVNGEFWQNTETNYWNHVDATTGLLIGHFGTDGNLAKFVQGAPQMAGNAFGVAMAKQGGNYYIYHCDESVHAFVHSWKVSGLNTVQITSVPITLSGAITLPTDAANLMSAVPYQSSGFYGGGGWTMNPAAYDNHTFGAQYGDQYPDWRVTTSKNSFRKDDIDIYIESDANANGTYKTVSKDLGSNNTNNWTLSFGYKINSNLNENYDIDLLDATGKMLLTFGTQNIFHQINGSHYQENALNANTLLYRFANLSVKNISGQVSVSIDGYPYVNVVSNDVGGNFNTPATFRVRAGGSGDQHHTLLSVKGLRFVPGSNVAAP